MTFEEAFADELFKLAADAPEGFWARHPRLKGAATAAALMGAGHIGGGTVLKAVGAPFAAVGRYYARKAEAGIPQYLKDIRSTEAQHTLKTEKEAMEAASTVRSKAEAARKARIEAIKKATQGEEAGKGTAESK